MTELSRVQIDKVVEGQAQRLEGGPFGVCLVRIGDDFFALADRCSHANVLLSEGDVDTYDCTVECWKHGSSFLLRDGEPQSLPATHGVAVYKVSVEGDEVVVSD